MEKDFLSPSLSRAQPTSLPSPAACFPSFPLSLPCSGPASARPTSWPRCSSQRRTPLPFATADDRAGPRFSVTARWGPAVRLVSHLESGQDTSPSSTLARVSRELSSFRPILALYIAPPTPRNPLSHSEPQPPRQTRRSPRPRSAPQPNRHCSAFQAS